MKNLIAFTHTKKKMQFSRLTGVKTLYKGFFKLKLKIL